jgi:hypothetical protein
MRCERQIAASSGEDLRCLHRIPAGSCQRPSSKPIAGSQRERLLRGAQFRAVNFAHGVLSAS